ncbi:MAG: histidine phosphatase family protein [Cyanobacteriota bacterium]|nr:histidine phosphatase family protein [Cyanobacteriota bacterium]
MPLPELQPRDLVLIRHGETEWSLAGRHTGRTDLPLTPRGEAVAAGLAPVLAGTPFGQVLCSPLQRARRTAALAGFAEPRLDADLMEWNYGAYEGITTAEIRRQQPDWEVFSHGCPEGESPGEVAARVDGVIARLQQGEGPSLVVAHGHVLRMLLVRWLALPAAAGRHFLLDTATLSVLSHVRGDPVLKCWNAPLPQEAPATASAAAPSAA